METLIQCPHCQEDSNSADVDALHGHCPHCGLGIDHGWEAAFTGRRHPLARLRQRLELQPLLRSRAVYVS
ncbi:MAG: hypothetical protein SFU85_12910 [Candidatus Methylacidiphilales bacterium]|nr:hypothetical protein [Candidatus Methylacidiphilales bacterium]